MPMRIFVYLLTEIGSILIFKRELTNYFLFSIIMFIFIKFSMIKFEKLRVTIGGLRFCSKNIFFVFWLSQS